MEELCSKPFENQSTKIPILFVVMIKESQAKTS
jgi:hypothetical protein